MTVQQLYEETVRPLPAADRLRLATLILNEIPPQALVDYSDSWSEQDLREFSAAAWDQVDQTLAKARDA